MRILRIVLPAVLVTAIVGTPVVGADIPIGAGTHAVAINHTTGLAYVGAACTCGGSVFVVDTATDTVVANITTVATPTQIAVDEERDRIFAAHFDTGRISVIDGATNSLSSSQLPLGGLGLAVNPARDLLYATLGTGGMAVYDLNTLALDRTVPVATLAANWWGVAVNPVTDRIYVENLLGAVDVLDGETYSHIEDISIFGEARLGITVDVAANLVYVPRYVANGRVHVIDGATNTLRGDFAASGSFPRALALDAAAQRLYSADTGSGTVTVFSTAGTLTRLETISIGGQPNGIAMPTRGQKRLYVTNALLGDLTVLSVAVNARPVVTAVTIAPASPHTNDVLSTTVAAQDPNGDLLTYAYQWTKNGADIAGATGLSLDLSLSGNGDRGDLIAVRVTASDGSATSDPFPSATVTVLNTAPAMVAATIAPTSPDTNDVLTVTAVAQDVDNDLLTYSYQWTRNGADIAGATGDTLDLAVSGNGDRDQEIAVRVFASDGTASSEALTSAAVTVLNTPPVMLSATIAPASPETDDVLSATVVAQDADSDPVTYAFQWTKNAADIVGATGQTLDLAVSGNGDDGDEIAVRVTASDGTAASDPLTSAAVTVLDSNTPPAMVSAAVAPTSPDTDDILTAIVSAADADGDVLSYAYQWTKNGVDIVGATGDTLDLGLGGNGDRGDQIAVRVTARDASATSEPLTSASVVVRNSAPSVSVTLTPEKPSHRELITAGAAVADADRDAVVLTYVWRVEGEVRRTVTTTATSDQFDLSLPHNGTPHDTITLTVTPHDGLTAGTAGTATAIILPGN